MAGKFHLKKSSDGQFRFVLKAGNGETILTSELYRVKPSALNGIESVRKNAPLDERYERKLDKAGHPRFNLKAANHEIIGSSESYSSEAARDAGIASVKANAPVAALETKPPKAPDWFHPPHSAQCKQGDLIRKSINSLDRRLATDFS